MNSDGTCAGCFRSLREIAQWSTASDDEKLKIKRNAQQRQCNAAQELPPIVESIAAQKKS